MKSKQKSKKSTVDFELDFGNSYKSRRMLEQLHQLAKLRGISINQLLCEIVAQQLYQDKIQRAVNPLLKEFKQQIETIRKK